MNPMDLISMLLGFLGSIPVVGSVLAVVAKFAIPASACVTALVAVWHAVVGVLTALSLAVPSLAGVAASLKADEDTITSFENSWILPILNRLSLIPLPQAPVAPATPAAK